MNTFVRGVLVFLSVLLITRVQTDGQVQAAGDSKHVAFDGLKSSYDSCVLVTFSVRSISETGIYFEVYAENFEGGSWVLVDYPYDLKEPMSLYVKRAYVDRKLMKSGDSIALSYDRCSKPKFVETTQRAFTKKIVNHDKTASSPVLQRFFSNVYTLKEGNPVLLTKEYSPSFSRIAPKE
jgi:hypothetical protein